MPVLNSFTFSPSKMFILLRLAVLALVLIVSRTNSIPVASDNQAMMYLSQFGYLSPAVRNPQSEQILSSDVLTKAIQEFQAFAGINVTGDLNPETVELMNMPRCGVKDKIGFGTSSRSKRYALQGSRWRVKDLTYKISKYPHNLAKTDTEKVVKEAFGVWASVTPLTFTQKKTGPVHIEIRFERGEHGDGDPFDGPGGTLAHAFFPVYGGDAHFDDAEKWTVNSYRGTNLFQVAAHEFGHSLGLSHSDVRAALMAPFYRGYEPSFELHDDDVEAIQSLYGEKDSDNKGSGSGSKPATDAPPDEGGEDSELCNDATIDTIFNSAEGITYVFKGLHYWKLTETSIEKGYPRLISKSWIGLPGNIDAAFTYKNGKTYFFKGTKYWRYTGKLMDGDYPKEISEGFTGIPNNIDAAMVWGGNGKIYFYKGSKFWRFDPTQKPPVKSTYPKPISNWEGVPNDLDGALQYTNGYTYFFKGGSYWRFNDRAFMVDSADPPFPRPAGYWWFGCRAETKGSYTGTVHSASAQSEQRHEAKHRNNSDDVGDIILDGDDPPTIRDGSGKDTEPAPHHSSANPTTSSISVALLLVALLRIC